jgi:predicted transcriptional regulator of viral defense system
MPIQLPPEASQLIRDQSSVLARSQSDKAKLSAVTMRTQVKNERWQRMHRGVYTIHSGHPKRDAFLWAALLRAGDSAVLSHYTAAEQYGLTNKPSRAVHITVPAERHPARQRIPGIVIHRSDSILRTRHPAKSIPCTRVEDTVLDLIQIARTFDDAYEWICRAVGRGKTTPAKLLDAMDARKKMRWRKDLELALADADNGVLSVLERRYTTGVERAHGLPQACRQVRIEQETGIKYLDNLYAEYRVCVELDGTAAHPADQQWRDKHRDNWNLAREQTVTLRFGFLDLRDQQARCETATYVAPVLLSRGLPLAPHPCSPTCPLRAGS